MPWSPISHARRADLVEEPVRDRVPLGDEVPARDEAVAALELDHAHDVRDAGRPLDVVGEHARVVLAVGPEVDDREAVEARRTQLGEQLAVTVLDEARLERPRRELPLRLLRRVGAP